MNQTLENLTSNTLTNGTNVSSLRIGYRFWGVLIYSVLLVSGTVLNIMVVFVLLRSGKMRQNISSFLIFHLSVTHLLLHVGIPIFQYIDVFKGNSTSCTILVFSSLTCAVVIFSSLVAIAWDRHRNVLRPFKSLAPRKFKVYSTLMTAIWMYAFITSAPFIFSIKTDHVVICSKEKNGAEICTEKSICHFQATDWKTKLSETIYFSLAFVIPLLYMFFAYAKIAVSLWKRSRNGTIHSAVAKCKVKSTRLMIIAVFGFVFCWGPTFFADLFAVYGVYDYSNLELQYWCYLGQLSSSSINPVIFAFFSPEFRKSFLKYCSFSCCRCWCRVLSRQRRQCDGNRVEPVM